MKIILLKDVENLGKLGDEVNVKDGFATNYLIPNKLVVESSKAALKMLERKKTERLRQEKQLKESCEKLAERIKSASCTISVDTGEDEKLFGSVTRDMIAETLRTDGIELDKKNILLDEPIKSLGVFNVDIKLHPEVSAQLRVWIVKK